MTWKILTFTYLLIFTANQKLLAVLKQLGADSVRLLNSNKKYCNQKLIYSASFVKSDLENSTIEFPR